MNTQKISWISLNFLKILETFLKISKLPWSFANFLEVLETSQELKGVLWRFLDFPNVLRTNFGYLYFSKVLETTSFSRAYLINYKVIIKGILWCSSFLWCSSEFPETSLQISELHWSSLDFLGDPWIFLNFSSLFLKISKLSWNLADFLEVLVTSLELKSFLWSFCDSLMFLELHYGFLDFPKVLGLMKCPI